MAALRPVGLWVTAGALLTATLWLLAAGGAMPWPLPAPPVKVAPPSPEITPPGVVLWGRDLGGISAGRLRTWLSGLAPDLHLPPVDAVIDPVTGGVIPALDGLSLDVDATLEAVLAANPGERVRPVFQRLPAGVGLEDLPPAAVWQGNPRRRQVTFLINVAWGTGEIPGMLAVLADLEVRATFFLTGRWADDHPDAARGIAAAGHELANHGMEAGRDGPGALAPDALAAHIADAAAAVEAAAGVRTRLFSPHKGEISPHMAEVARAQDHLLVRWSLDTVDWQDPPPDTLVARIVEHLHGGALILMHPRPVTVAALPRLVRGIREAGYEIVVLSELLSPEPPSHLHPELPAGAPGP